MSEISMDEFEEQFTERDPIVTDPAITRGFEMIKEINESLQVLPVSAEQIKNTVVLIDTQWQSLLNTAVLVTGDVAFSDQPDDHDRMASPRQFVDEQMSFYGVGVVLTGQDIADPDRSYYQLRVVFNRIVKDEDDNDTIVQGWAKIDDVISLEFIEDFSRDGAQKWLEEFLPETLAEIDAVIEDAAGDECRAVLNLAKLCVTMDEWAHAMREKTIHALRIYCNTSLQFDDVLPYEADISGRVYGPVGEDDVVATTEAGFHALLAIRCLSWATTEDDENDQWVIVPALEAGVIMPRPMEIQALNIPLSSVKTLISTGQDFFHNPRSV